MPKRASITAIAAILLWAATIAAPWVSAQDNQTDAATRGQSLSADGLKLMLDNMGYEPKKIGTGYLISIKKDDWTYYIQLVVSSDGTRIGFNSNLGVVENVDGVTAAQWMDLLVANGNIDPSFFFFDKETKKLYLHRVLDNRAITAAYMRQQVDNFCSNVKGTADKWKFTK